MTALAVLGIVVFVVCGVWQWDRGVARQAVWQDFTTGGAPAIDPGARSLEALPRFTRVRLAGRYDGEHQILLDNRTHAGRAGYEVLTPFELQDGRWVLVNRGWIPFSGYRDRLPDAALAGPSASVTVTGRVDTLPTQGMAAGHAPPTVDASWPKVTSYPQHDELVAALGRPLETRQVLLDATAADGYLREWQAPGVPPERHFSYAAQWWLFAATVAVLYVILNLHKTDR